MNKVMFAATPFGKIGLVSNGEALVGVVFAASSLPENCLLAKGDALLLQAEAQLQEYFKGERRDFDLPLAPRGTAFQMQVWNALQDIPYGETRSYADVAAAVGNPRATRAVGYANNKNPLPIFIPCHRVVGKNGALTGYAGGIAIKTFLLELESGQALY